MGLTLVYESSYKSRCAKRIKALRKADITLQVTDDVVSQRVFVHDEDFQRAKDVLAEVAIREITGEKI